MQCLYERSGCIHVHSRYSDGSGSVKTIARAAQEASLDFVIVTDHDTLRAKKHEGYHGKCLLLAGEEISPLKNHLLALNVKRSVPHHFCEQAQEYIDQVRGQGGLGFVTHPFGESRLNLLFHKVKIHKWEDWAAQGLSGIEVWSYMIDWIEDVHIWNLWEAIKNPDERITGPSREILAKWDEVGKKQRFVGIGSLDAHAKNLIPLLPVIQVFPYKQMFHTIRTHVLFEKPLAGRDAKTDSAYLYKALGEGRSYMANHKIGDPSGFRFWLECGNQIYSMGEEIARPGARTADFVIQTPVASDISLLCDGEVVGLAEGTELLHRLEHKGVYRVEVFRDGKPWIYSNPIYVR